MFQLNTQSIFQFGSLIVYAILISLVLCSKKVVLKKLFTIFLIAASGISLAGLLINLGLPYEQTGILEAVRDPVYHLDDRRLRSLYGRLRS